MRHPNDLYDFQKEAVLHQLYYPHSMLWLQMGLGKEQPNSEPILTPDGWRPIGEIMVGDTVIGANGEPTKVLGVFPQGNKEVVSITFSDGTFARCGWEHLWRVKTNHDLQSGKPWRVMTTRTIVDSGLKQGDNSKYLIPVCSPVEYRHKRLPVDPYLLGVILGDGSVSESSGVVVCTDTETLTKCAASSIKPHESSSYTSYGYIPGVKQHMRDLDLMGKRSWEKCIPEVYLRASIDQRLSLLQGLLDTDGSPIEGGGVEFSSTSENLTDAVVDLTQSLGGIARKARPRVTRHQGGNGRPSWRVNVKLPCEFDPFTLTRKLTRWVRPTKYQPHRRIRAVGVTGHEESTCISVAAKDNLYLTRNHVVTHNTAVTLTSIVDRMRAGQVRKTLVFGPLRVIHAVWEREARKWSHTAGLRFSVIHGTPDKRQRALFLDADVYLINYENMTWFSGFLKKYYLDRGEPLPFQMVVYDEVSKLKNPTSLRMAGGRRDRKSKRGEMIRVDYTGWRKIIPHIPYRSGLTGTPASNGYLDLFGQYLAVDGGDRFGESITHFRDSYFDRGYNGWSYTPTIIGEKIIEAKISDITIKADTKDHLDLPPATEVNMMVDLPAAARKAYEEVEADLFTRLDSGTEVELFSKTSISNKCLQFCNGSPYTEGKQWEAVHDAKLEALDDIIEEAAGQPVLCGYNFVPDAQRIMTRYKKLNPINLTGMAATKTEAVIDKWNSGGVRLLIGHPASIGHGIDGLQESGSIVTWFGLNWSLELYLQLNQRIDRNGQDNPVSIIRILCNDTVDLAVADALERKTDDQEGLKAAIERYRRGETTNDLRPSFY